MKSAVCSDNSPFWLCDLECARRDLKILDSPLHRRRQAVQVFSSLEGAVACMDQQLPHRSRHRQPDYSDLGVIENILDRFGKEICTALRYVQRPWEDSEDLLDVRAARNNVVHPAPWKSYQIPAWVMESATAIDSFLVELAALPPGVTAYDPCWDCWSRDEYRSRKTPDLGRWPPAASRRFIVELMDDLRITRAELEDQDSPLSQRRYVAMLPSAAEGLIAALCNELRPPKWRGTPWQRDLSTSHEMADVLKRYAVRCPAIGTLSVPWAELQAVRCARNRVMHSTQQVEIPSHVLEYARDVYDFILEVVRITGIESRDDCSDCD